jgi:excisionase family DNA binding protein
METAISRDEAAKLLKISTRTLDRYVRQRKISSVRRGRHILYELDELRRFRQKMDSKIQPSFDMSEATFVEELRSSTDKQEIVDAKITSNNDRSQHSSDAVYKALYQEANQELKKKEELLLGANYRVGQLEAKLQNMVPMLEFKRQKEESETLRLSLNTTKKDLDETSKVCHILQQNVNIERFNKKIFSALFFLTLSLFPIFMLIVFLIQ